MTARSGSALGAPGLRLSRTSLASVGCVIVRLAFSVCMAALVAAGTCGASPDGRAVRLASATVKANLWIDRDGGSCRRSSGGVVHPDAVACGSIDAAWDACRPGNTIVRAGQASTARQKITRRKVAPGCTVRGERGTTIGDLVTGGAYFTLRNVTVAVGEAKHAGWKVSASNVTLADVRLHGPFVRVDMYRVANIRWVGGELGISGRTGGKRVCGRDALPVQIGEADRVTIDNVRFHPQDADPTPSACSSNGFHLETIRLDGGTSFFTLRNSTFDSGDHSGTATIFITEPGGDAEPHDLTFENNFFGTSDSIVALNVHSNVSRCANFTFAYNTFLKTPGLFQCTAAVNVRWIGNLGPNGPSSPCFGTSVNNVWQDPAATAAAPTNGCPAPATRPIGSVSAVPTAFACKPAHRRLTPASEVATALPASGRGTTAARVVPEALAATRARTSTTRRGEGRSTSRWSRSPGARQPPVLACSRWSSASRRTSRPT